MGFLWFCVSKLRLGFAENRIVCFRPSENPADDGLQTGYLKVNIYVQR